MEKTKKLILICDDEAEYRKLFSDKLISEDFDVIESSDGENGLKMAIDRHPDIILLDLNMPGIGGMGMLKELRKDSWGKHAKVIILTNVSDNAKIAEAMMHETFVYLVKSDMSMEELVSRVKKTLSLPPI